MALEHLSVVLSRQALLDIHLQLWIVAGFLCLVLDRRWIDRRTPRGPPAGPRASDGEAGVPSPLWRPWRYAAGIAFGAAVSVKWSGGLGMLTAIVVSLMWETSRRRRGDTTRGASVRTGARAGELRARPRLRRSSRRSSTSSPTSRGSITSVGTSAQFLDQQLRIAKYHLFVLKTEAIDPATGSADADALRLLAAMDVVVDEAAAAADVAGRRTADPGSPGDRQPGGVLGELLVVAVPRVRLVEEARLGARIRPDGRPAPVRAVGPGVAAAVLLLRGAVHAVPGARARRTWSATCRMPGSSSASPVARSRPTRRRADPRSPSGIPYRPIAWAIVAGAVALFIWFWPVLTWMLISDERFKLIVWFPGWQ